MIIFQSDFFDFIIEYSLAIAAPSFALFLMSAIFDFNESPPVNSLILFNKNGVISAPLIFYSSASLID